MTQATLFDDETGLTGQFQPGKPDPVVPLSRTTDPRTSKLAAKQFTQSGALKGHQETLVWCSDSHGGFWTAHEIAKYSERTGSPLDSVQVTRRIKALVEKDVLEAGPDRRCLCGCGRLMGTHRSKKV